MEDSVRQMIGACFIALAEAAGPGVLEHANQTLDDAVKSGAVSDPVAQRAILILTRCCKVQTVTADMAEIVEAIGDESLYSLMAPIKGRAATLSAETPPEYILEFIAKVDELQAALERLQPATAVA